MLLPLAGTPAFVRAVTDRSFTFWQLCVAMPDVMILLAAAAAPERRWPRCRVAALLR